MAYESGQQLPDKLYFRIGEVSDIVGVKPYVLRYWETEFPDIKPTKSKSGQRLYRKKDVELLLKIRELLYTERFTINGAKQRLKEVGKVVAPEVVPTPKEVLQEPAPVVEPQVMQNVFKEPEVVQTREQDLPQPAAEVLPSGKDKKFLEKMKHDLVWCLTEIRSS